MAMTTSQEPYRATRLGLLAGGLALLIAASCDGDTIVNAVPDWGGGPRSPYVPEGYELVFDENFDQLALASDPTPITASGGSGGLGMNGQQSGWHEPWESHYAGWGARHLEGNNDKALKADASYRGRGGKSLGEHGIRLHEVTDEGTLKLLGMPTPEDLRAQFYDMPYLGGMISGERQHAQKYGYWELRIRFPILSAGHHWAIWLIPSDHSWPPEIDMVEVVGSNPDNQSDSDHFMFNSILKEDNDDVYTRVVPPRGHDAWYTVGFLWNETDMRWFLDGEEVRRRPSLETDKELYFLISPEIGSNWPGEPTSDTEWPVEAELDYVRVYRAPTAGG